MEEYTKLMESIIMTDDESEAPNVRVAAARTRNWPVRYLIALLGIAVIVYIVAGSWPISTPTSRVPIVRKQVKIIVVHPDVPLNITDDTDYTDRVRTNIQNMMENYTDFLYQSRDEPIRPFVNMYGKYQIETHYNLSTCMTPKAMATTLHGIFCYLHDSEEFERRNMTLETVYWTDQLCDFNALPRPQSTATLSDFIAEEHSAFQIVREPIKRFVSAFINKCINEHLTGKKTHPNWKYCYDCDEDIACVVRKARDDIMERSRNDREFKGPQDDEYFSSHFYPLTWQCDLADRFEIVNFIRYVSGGEKKAEMMNQLLSVMKSAGVEEYKLRRISGVLLNDEPLTHATKGTSLPSQLLKKIYASQEMLDTLTQLYYYDYLVFEYPFPKLGEISDFD